MLAGGMDIQKAGPVAYRILDALMEKENSEANRKKYKISPALWEKMFGRLVLYKMKSWIESTYYKGPDHVEEFIKYRIESMKRGDMRA